MEDKLINKLLSYGAYIDFENYKSYNYKEIDDDKTILKLWVSNQEVKFMIDKNGDYFIENWEYEYVELTEINLWKSMYYHLLEDMSIEYDFGSYLEE